MTIQSAFPVTESVAVLSEENTPIGAGALWLLGLMPQDRIVAMTQAAFGRPREEYVLHVECVDNERNLVHCLTSGGCRSVVPMQEIVDVQVAVDPIEIEVSPSIWDAHQCDPQFRGRPVRAISVLVSQSGRFQGVCVPKWPGARPGEQLTLDMSCSAIGRSEAEVFGRLPTNRYVRYHDPERARRSATRTAEARVRRWLVGNTGAQGPYRSLPVDPTCRVKGGQLLAVQ